MATPINDNRLLKAPKLLDVRRGPWPDTAAALAFVEDYMRIEGLELYVYEDGVLYEYWFHGGTEDHHLVRRRYLTDEEHGNLHLRLHSLISEHDHKTEIEHAEKVTGWDHEGKPTAREVTPLETEPLPIVPLIIESTDTRLLVEHGEEIRLTVQPFVQTFTVADWTVTAGGYYIDFVHGFQSDVKSELKSGTKKVHAQTVSISDTIERVFVPSDPDLRFEGTIIITK